MSNTNTGNRNLQIATILGVYTHQIERIEEWQHVFFCVMGKTFGRATFISKKLISASQSIAQALSKPSIRVERLLDRVVTKAAAAARSTVARPVLRSKPVAAGTKEPQYVVERLHDNGGSYFGDRVISVLVREIGSLAPAFWDSVFIHQDIKRFDVVKYSHTNLVKVPQG